MNVARQAAFLALLEWHQKGTFVWDFLEGWKKEAAPSKEDLNFAYELACGTIRQLRFLDDAAISLAKKLPSKVKERSLLRLGLYQLYFLPNIPRYAVCNTMVELAKKYTHTSFASFLNAILRKKLPKAKIRHSYPDFFLQKLQEQYSSEQVETILERGNLPSTPIQVPYGNSCYIQNRTQPELLEKLAALLPTFPHRILDMCAAPGGKTLFLHHRYPESELIANDSAPGKIEMLKENLERFHCHAEVFNERGELLTFLKPFDLIVVDAPCSNSGVLYKCPEARWRLSQETIDLLQITQEALLTRACQLLSPTGKIWYMTCSILREENDLLVQRVCDTLKLRIEKTVLQLPDAEGHEGGFCAAISKF